MNISFKKKIVKLKSVLILNKTKRKEYREAEFKKFEQQLKSSAKWGVSYSLFDGEELLEPSLLSIRENVDYINVVYQKESWVGQKAAKNIEELLKNLEKKGLIDEIIEYKVKPDVKCSFTQETMKRQLGLEHLVNAGCNYYLPMDVDEFYFGDEFENAKNFILDNNITYSFCAQIPYGLTPNDLIADVRCHPCYVAFFSKVDKNSILYGINKSGKSCLPCLVDKSRVLSSRKEFYSNSKTYFFTYIKMHHMSYVRNDLKRKFENSSTPSRRDSFYDDKFYNISKVDDVFEISKYLNISQNVQTEG